MKIGTRIGITGLILILSECDSGSSPASPGIQSFSGVYSLRTTVNPHACPAEAAAPAAGTMLIKTLILDDRRPDLSATLGGLPMTGTITASGSFTLFDPLEANRISGRVTSAEISGRITNAVLRLVGQQLTHLCDWSEEFTGTRQT